MTQFTKKDIEHLDNILPKSTKYCVVLTHSDLTGGRSVFTDKEAARACYDRMVEMFKNTDTKVSKALLED